MALGQQGSKLGSLNRPMREKTTVSSSIQFPSARTIFKKRGFAFLPELLEGQMLKLHYFGHLLQRANSLEKTLVLRRIEGRR